MIDMLYTIKLFYTLGFYSNYLVFGIIFAVLDGVYTYARVGAAIKHFRCNQKSVKSQVFRILFALLIASFCINIWAPSFQLIAFPLFIGSLTWDIVAKVVGTIYHVLCKTRKAKGDVAKFCSGAYWTGAILFISYACFIGWANFNLTNVLNTEYTFASNKVTQPLNILFLSDIHYGTIEDPDELVTIVNQINQNKTEYDVVVLGGDIVDERTSNENMNRAFDLLGKIDAKDGVYFVYGNHDRQPSETDLPLAGRSFTDEELIQACERNNIRILEDSAVDLGEFVLAGRADYGWEGDGEEREDSASILDGQDKDKLVVMVDHQAVMMEENAQTGADIQLSGHNHGGQTWPFGLLLRYVLNRPVWGEYNYGDLTLFISSGLAGWGSPIRDEGVSEYMTLCVVPAEPIEQ